MLRVLAKQLAATTAAERPAAVLGGAMTHGRRRVEQPQLAGFDSEPRHEGRPVAALAHRAMAMTAEERREIDFEPNSATETRPCNGLHAHFSFFRERTNSASSPGNPVRLERDAAGSEPRGTRFLHRAGEDINPRNDDETRETRCLNQGRQLCLRQSAGDSTGPELYLRFGRFRNRSFYD